MRDDKPSYDIGRLRSKRFPDGECVLTFWRDGRRTRLRIGTADEAEARRRAPALYAEALRPRGTTVAELWEAYRVDKAGKVVVENMPYQWKALGPHFGTKNAESITAADCRAYTEARRSLRTARHPNGIKDGAIITELGRIRMVLLWAEKQGHITRAPHIERPAAVKRTKDRHLTAFQVSRLAEACATPHLTLFVHLAFATAGRAAAILGLTWERVDFERNKIDLEDPEIKVAHKGRAVVPLTRTLRLRLLEAQRGARTPFVIEWAGRRVGSVKKGLASAAREAGLPHVHPHMLRHSAAVRQAEAGVPMEEIASYLGHSNPSITRLIYARFSPEALSRGAAALELDDLEPREVLRSAVR